MVIWLLPASGGCGTGSKRRKIKRARVFVIAAAHRLQVPGASVADVGRGAAFERFALRRCAMAGGRFVFRLFVPRFGTVRA